MDFDITSPGARSVERRERIRVAPPLAGSPDLEWIVTSGQAPYFTTESGVDWHPIGHNEAISWPNLAPLFRDGDPAPVDRHLASLARRGITVLRIMLDYAQFDRWALERPVGRFRPVLVGRWDLFMRLCAIHRIRLLITPFDTFWMWMRFKRHPYNAALGGPLAHPSQTLLCPRTRDAIKARLSFAVRRWGASGVIFAWDLWNEIHPAHGGDSAEPFLPFIADLSQHVRAEEQRLFGRSHLQTVSLFGPELVWRAHMPLEEPIFRHPALDFSTIHIYREGTIDDPSNTVDPAVSMGEIVASSIAATVPGRPFLDSEHGPIHRFKDHKHTLPAPFDDEYFRLMSWAHLASGGAGGGMRWPNRSPHVLTEGMHEAQGAMARFLPLIDWARFDRRVVSREVELSEGGRPIGPAQVARFAVASDDQAVLYLIRRDGLAADGRIEPDLKPRSLRVCVPGLNAGCYRITSWSTLRGEPLGSAVERLDGGWFALPPLSGDLAVAIRALAPG